jgi:hypothetical protein
MPVNFGKVILNALRPKTLENNRHEAPQKLRNSSLSRVLVDDLLLFCLDLVRLAVTISSRLKQHNFPKKNFSAASYESHELLEASGSQIHKPRVASPLSP